MTSGETSDWPPPPPGGATSHQRAYFSELLSYGLKPEDVVSESVFEMEDMKTQKPPLAAAFAADGALADVRPTNVSELAFDNHAIEPKVITAYKPKPGGMPRKLEIERRKRLYAAQDIETLLMAKGIDYSVPYSSQLLGGKGDEGDVPPGSALPLIVFDNGDFEVHTADAWLAMGTDDAGNQQGLPCRALHMRDEATEQGVWRRGKVVSYDAAAERFGVAWDPDEGAAPETEPVEPTPVHRMHICFVAEDPFVFVERVTDAHARRRDAEAVLLHNLYVDCMPTEGTKPLDSELCGRILALAINTKALRRTALETSRVIAEVNTDYTRTLNKIVFRATHAAEGDTNELLRAIVLPREEAKPPPRRQGTIALPPGYDFGVAYKEFRFHSCLTRPEIIKIVVNVKQECLKVMALSFFNFLTKSVRVEEFANTQHEATQAVAGRLRESWPSNVCGHVRQQLKDVKKGWFNLEEANNEVYAFSKLKKFLQFVNFMMQDSMRYLVRGSNDVTTTYPTAGVASKAKRLPLFLIDIVIVGEGDDKTLGYSSNLAAFEEIPLKHFDQAIIQTQSIVQVERRVMTRLFWSHDPIMTSVHPTEQWVIDLRAEVAQTLRAAVAPLEAYLATYDGFLEFLRLDVDAYIGDAEANLAEKHLGEQKKVEALIPETVAVGLFAVSGKTVGRILAEKHGRIAKMLLDLVAIKTNQHAADSTVSFGDIMRKLNAKPTNIEELTELRDYMETIPDAVSSAGPKKVADKCEELEEHCLKLEKSYENDMEEAQGEFRERLRGYMDEVDNLRTFYDLKLVDQVSAHVRRIKKDLASAEDEARLFNSREALFNKEVTQYDLLRDVAKKFEPYGNMWEQVDHWLQYHKKWMSDDFLKLDAEGIETDTTTIYRVLVKCEKTFEAQKLDGCLNVCRTILGQVNEFRPHVPLVIALRQQGMRDRHWENLSQKIKVDVKPDESYTLETIFEMKLQDHVDVITKISEVAGKEYAIENSLDTMEKAWSDVTLQIEPYKETGTSILRGIDEYMALLDEHITTTQAMTFSAFKGPFEERIEKWNTTLQIVSELIDEWVAVQKNWLYLQPIFDSPDINKQLPVEGKRFATVDKHWRQTLNSAASGTTLAILFCNDPKLLERFRESNKLLDMVQKGLSDYLETKRAGFSRFYFLSDGDLLEILSETKDPRMGIKSLDFEADLTISRMNSSEKEIVDFVAPVNPVNKNIEDWMVEINVAMCKAVRDHMIRAVRAYPETKRTRWMIEWPGQVVLNGSQVHWTQEVEEIMASKGNAGIFEYYEQCKSQLQDMVILIRTDLSKGQRTTVGALAVIDVHARATS
ncbi:dynein light chain binding protein [Aureococcus anophagefferens]|nr:dynein light chain binding protein [Aureococcus anophagefferens]